MIRKRFLLKAKQRVMLIRLIAFFLIVSLLPLLIVGTIMTAQISNHFRQLSLDTVLREFESFPRGNYYESLTGEYRPEDLPGLYSYLKSKERLIQVISMLKGSNEFIDSVYLLDQGKQVILTSDKLQYQPNRFYDSGWDKDIQLLQFYPTVAEPSGNWTRSTHEESHPNGLCFLFRLKIESDGSFTVQYMNEGPYRPLKTTMRIECNQWVELKVQWIADMSMLSFKLHR